MPNVKIFADEAILRLHQDQIQTVISKIEMILVDELSAQKQHVHVMFVPAIAGYGMAGVYVDLNYRPSPERTPDYVRSACQALANLISDALDSGCRVRAASQNLPITTAVDVVVSLKQSLPATSGGASAIPVKGNT